MARVKARLVAKDPVIARTLVKFSAAQLSSGEATSRLGLKNTSELLDLLGMTTLPFPSASAAKIEAMVAGLLREHEG